MRLRSFLPLAFVATILMLGAIAATARAADDNLSYARIVRLSYATGDVQIMRADPSSKWEPAFANMPIQQGFTIGTNNGIAEVEFEHGCALWLSQNSVLQFTELALSDGGRITKMTLAQGTASFQAGIEAADTFSVTTPQFEIAPVGKSGFRANSFTGGGSVSVYGGKVSVSASTGTQAVAKGETLTLNAGTQGRAAVSANPARDDWDRWVSNRENYLVTGENQTLQNASSPFSYGAADLSSYGAWNYVPGCGYGWQPYGMTAGWMPFLDGQWMNYSGIGWTWVSFEPWGWMPYHFGGWSNCGGGAAGWMWMPGENGYWNAGPVVWGTCGKQVCWSPAPPSGPLHPRHPRVIPPHAATNSVVMATKNLTKEGRYVVSSSAKTIASLREFSSPPLADGKMPTGESALANQSSEAASGTKVLVPTAANLASLRSLMGGAIPSPVGNMPNAAPPASTLHSSGTTGSLPATALKNAAPPPARIPPPPPSRSYAFAPSQPGQASARGSSSFSSSGSGGFRSGGSSSSSGSFSGSRSDSGGGSRGSSSSSSSSSASTSSASGGGGGGRPH